MVDSIILMTTILCGKTIHLNDYLIAYKLIDAKQIVTIPCDELIQLEVRPNNHAVDDSTMKVDFDLHENLRC
jgi:hypothetical protein